MKKNNQNSQIIIYKTEDGRTKIDVRFDGETVWLTQNALADLFQTTKNNISQHVKNIFKEDELDQAATVKKFLTVQKEGARKVSHELAKELAEKEYDKYYKKSLKAPSKADRDFETFANKAVKLVSKSKKKK